MISANIYIPPYVSGDLKCYERDGLLTYTERLKYERFEQNRDQYLQNVKLTYFDMIHAQCRGDKQQKSDKFYQTITEKNFKKMPQSCRKKALAACARTNRKDLYVQRYLMISYFKTL